MLAAFWVFVDAKEKGRSEGQALLWAVGTFLALIIFLPLWLFVRWQENKPKDLHICPSCHNSFKEIPKARYCPYCGYPLENFNHSHTIDIECQKDESDLDRTSGKSPQN
jgi:rubredoxin